MSRPSLKKYTILIAIIGLLGVPSSHAEDGEILRGLIKKRLAEKLIDQGEKAGIFPSPHKIDKSGDYTFSIVSGGLTRSYLVHVPENYNPSKPTPAVLAFHGGGGDMTYMAKDKLYGLITKSEQSGYILVFPNGYSKWESGKLATWNAGECCADARDEKIDDVGFVRRLVKNLAKQLHVDQKKIYAIGMSNGGMMAYRLACEATDLFKAIASVTGTENIRSCTPSKPISVLHIHAKDDTHVLFNGGAGKDAFRDMSKVTDFTSVPETVARWAARNNCTGNPERVLDKDGAYCDLYRNCANKEQVKLCVTEEGGHSWPGGNKPRSNEPPSRAISANDEIWKFFESL